MKKAPEIITISGAFYGLGERIRTSVLLNPIQARYQTAPHPDNLCSREHNIYYHIAFHLSTAFLFSLFFFKKPHRFVSNVLYIIWRYS